MIRSIAKRMYTTLNPPIKNMTVVYPAYNEISIDTPDGSDDGTGNRQFYYYAANADVIGTDSNYGFQYEFGNATEDGIVKPSITPSVFELRNPDADIYGKVI